MPKFPEPPSVETLAAIAPDTTTLSTDQVLMRVYSRGGAYPTTWDAFRTFGPTGARFDHHEPPPRVQERGILYAAHNALTCLAEVYQDTRLIDRSLRQPTLVGFELTRPVVLLDCTGAWPTRAGASMVIGSGMRARARRWARVMYAAYPHIDGIRYGSSMYANTPCVALFERAADAIPTSPVFHRPLADPSMLDALKNAAKTLGYGLQ